MLRRIGSALLFTAAAATAAWVAWPGSPAYLAASNQRALVIATIAVLAGLPLLARRLFGPADRSRISRALRACTYAAVLFLLPARDIIERFRDVPPRSGLDLSVYAVINGEHRIARTESWDGIAFLIIMGLCVAVILWLTSQRSSVAPATLAVGMGGGVAIGIVVYAVAPLGLSKAATNPWLPGSDVDPLVLLAWILVLGAPVAAGLLARRRYPASGSATVPSDPAVSRQIIGGALVTGLVGALLVTLLGTGTTALILKAAWLRNWLYHGQREFFGIAGLRYLVGGHQASIAYSHELTASVDSSMFLIMCVAFPLIALALGALPALSALPEAEAEPGGNPPRGGDSPRIPDVVPDGPTGAHLTAMTRHDAGPGLVMSTEP